MVMTAPGLATGQIKLAARRGEVKVANTEHSTSMRHTVKTVHGATLLLSGRTNALTSGGGSLLPGVSAQLSPAAQGQSGLLTARG